MAVAQQAGCSTARRWSTGDGHRLNSEARRRERESRLVVEQCQLCRDLGCRCMVMAVALLICGSYRLPFTDALLHLQAKEWRFPKADGKVPEARRSLQTSHN